MESAESRVFERLNELTYHRGSPATASFINNTPVEFEVFYSADANFSSPPFVTKVNVKVESSRGNMVNLQTVTNPLFVILLILLIISLSVALYRNATLSTVLGHLYGLFFIFVWDRFVKSNALRRVAKLLH